MTEALQKTRSAFVWTRVLRTPFWAMYMMLPAILYKELNATPLQIAVAMALKPTVSIVSLYWSAAIDRRPERLRGNVTWAGILGLLPFFFFPFIDNVWFFVAAFGFFMLFHRGVIPAWMEILKRNIPKESRERIFAYSSAFGYLGDGIFPFAIGWALDGYFGAWRWLFPAAAAISLIAIFFQRRIPIDTHPTKAPIRLSLSDPWKKAWNLVKSRPDFWQFQVGFMLGGGGLMIIQPALPLFFVDILNISYMEIAIALTLCKGIGFAASSPFWARWMQRVDLFRFSSLVTTLACLFPLILLGAQSHIAWLYFAYIIYGVMQGGSELSWNLSGPIFAHDDDSALYSSVNVLTVGLRGCVAPALGSLVCLYFGSTVTLLLGSAFCLLATARMATPTPQEAPTSNA